MNKLTDGQKKARAAVRAAAKELIAEIDRQTWQHGCVEFRADFHLMGTRYDRATCHGQPEPLSYPIYRSATAR